MSDVNDKVRATLLSLLLDPRCICVGLALGIIGYAIGRLGI